MASSAPWNRMSLPLDAEPGHHDTLAGRIARYRARQGGNPRKSLLSRFGPGLITGASDDDPSGIATYSQVGAQFGYGMCWAMFFIYPLMVAIQEISALIGRVTGQGIAANLREHYPPWLLRGIVGMLLLANVANLAADLGAMAEALGLLIGGPRHLYVVAFAVGCAALEIFSSYERYVNILKWTSLALLAYVAAALAIDIPWREVAWNTFVPHIQTNREWLVAMVALLGTTITPYCFFWQSSQEAEDERIDPLQKPLLEAPEQARPQMARIRLDTYAGMAYSNIISLFIIITTAATLHAHGVTEIATSAQAAEALRPIAGDFAFAIFAAGIIGVGLLAVPVLAGSSAYALGEALGWKVGLGRRPRDAKAFYGAVAVATLIGIGFNFVGIDPIKALFWSAVLNGVIAVPLMIVMMMMGRSPKIMGAFVLTPRLAAMGWLCTAVMAVAVTVMFATL